MYRSSLGNPNITKKLSRKAYCDFQDMIQARDFDEIRHWHHVNTPWCTDAIIEEYILQYVKQLDNI